MPDLSRRGLFKLLAAAVIAPSAAQAIASAPAAAVEQSEPTLVPFVQTHGIYQLQASAQVMAGDQVTIDLAPVGSWVRPARPGDRIIGRALERADGGDMLRIEMPGVCFAVTETRYAGR